MWAETLVTQCRPLDSAFRFCLIQLSSFFLPYFFNLFGFSIHWLNSLGSWEVEKEGREGGREGGLAQQSQTNDEITKKIGQWQTFFLTTM